MHNVTTGLVLYAFRFFFTIDEMGISNSVSVSASWTDVISINAFCTVNTILATAFWDTKIIHIIPQAHYGINLLESASVKRLQL